MSKKQDKGTKIGRRDVLDTVVKGAVVAAAGAVALAPGEAKAGLVNELTQTDLQELQQALGGLQITKGGIRKIPVVTSKGRSYMVHVASQNTGWQ